jgi:hypothetical protein
VAPPARCGVSFQEKATRTVYPERRVTVIARRRHSGQSVRVLNDLARVERSESGAALAAAFGAVVVMWIAACFAVGVALTAPMAGFDNGDTDAGRPLELVAFTAAVLLFLGSGPVAWMISGRRWTVTVPLIGLILWGIGIGVAAVSDLP